MPWTKVDPAVKPLNQPTSSTCWYSCLRMLFTWKGLDPNDILPKLNDDINCAPDYWLKEGVAPHNCLPIARCLGLQAAGDGEADGEVLANALKSHGPYWVAGEWMKGSPHVVVVTGCNPAGGLVKMVNPWMNHDLSETEDLLNNFNNRGKIWGNTFGSMMYWK